MTRDRPPRARIGRCMHYRPAVAPATTCAAGVNYAELVGDKAGWFGRLPCLGQGPDTAKCEHMRAPRPDEIDAWERWSEWRTQMLREGITRCVLDREENGGKLEGTVECPICEGELRYTVSPSNDHMHGKCVSTRDCLAWMQ